jgi:hypothetical protein
MPAITIPQAGDEIVANWGAAVTTSLNQSIGARAIVRAPGASQTLTNVETDLGGATLTLGPGTFLLAGIFDFDVSVAAASLICSGRLMVDGVTQTGEAQVFFGATGTGRSTCEMLWLVTVPTGSAGIVKLRVLKGTASGTAAAVSGLCALVVL